VEISPAQLFFFTSLARVVVPKMVKNGNNSLLGIHNQSGLYKESMPSKLTQPLNQELKPFFTN